MDLQVTYKQSPVIDEIRDKCLNMPEDELVDFLIKMKTGDRELAIELAKLIKTQRLNAGLMVYLGTLQEININVYFYVYGMMSPYKIVKNKLTSSASSNVYLNSLVEKPQKGRLTSDQLNAMIFGSQQKLLPESWEKAIGGEIR